MRARPVRRRSAPSASSPRCSTSAPSRWVGVGEMRGSGRSFSLNNHASSPPCSTSAPSRWVGVYEGTCFLALFVRLWGVGMSWSGWLIFSLAHHGRAARGVHQAKVGRRRRCVFPATQRHWPHIAACLGSGSTSLLNQRTNQSVPSAHVAMQPSAPCPMQSRRDRVAAKLVPAAPLPT